MIPTAVEFFLHGSMESTKGAASKADAPKKPPSPGGDSVPSIDTKSPDQAPTKDALATSSLIEPGASGSQLADSFAGAIGHELSVQGAEGELQ